MAEITSVIVCEDKHEADITLDGEVYRVTEADVKKLCLEEGEVSDDTVEAIIICAQRLSCIKKAFSCLSYGDISVKKLAEKLSDKFGPEMASEVAKLMAQRGYIDESRAAERYAANCAICKRWGRIRIKNELRRRGYDQNTATDAVATVGNDIIADNLLYLIQKKSPSGCPDDIKTKSKLCACLQRMGYSYGEINAALKASNEQDDDFAD